MSTPSSTEKFVTGDLVTYKYAGKTYTGKIVEPWDKVDGWYSMDVDGYGRCVLPGYNMKRTIPPAVCRSCGKEGSHSCQGLQFCQDIRKLNLAPLTVEDITKHYEIREREIVQWISRRLEERIEDWHKRSLSLEEAAANPELDVVYGFDQGYLAGIRAAIRITDEMQGRLDK